MDFSELLKSIKTNKYKIKFDWIIEWKKWAVKFRTPKFVQWSEITEDEFREARSIALSLRENYNKKPDVAEETVSNDMPEEELPF